jgi:hypothetical protein
VRVHVHQQVGLPGIVLEHEAADFHFATRGKHRLLRHQRVEAGAVGAQRRDEAEGPVAGEISPRGGAGADGRAAGAAAEQEGREQAQEPYPANGME